MIVQKKNDDKKLQNFCHLKSRSFHPLDCSLWLGKLCNIKPRKDCYPKAKRSICFEVVENQANANTRRRCRPNKRDTSNFQRNLIRKRSLSLPTDKALSLVLYFNYSVIAFVHNGLISEVDRTALCSLFRVNGRFHWSVGPREREATQGFRLPEQRWVNDALRARPLCLLLQRCRSLGNWYVIPYVCSGSIVVPYPNHICGQATRAARWRSGRCPPGRVWGGSPRPILRGSRAWSSHETVPRSWPLPSTVLLASTVCGRGRYWRSSGPIRSARILTSACIHSHSSPDPPSLPRL